MKQGELCRRDSDCETGLMCAEMPGRETKSCQPPTTSNKLYSALTNAYSALLKYTQEQEDTITHQNESLK